LNAFDTANFCCCCCCCCWFVTRTRKALVIDRFLHSDCAPLYLSCNVAGNCLAGCQQEFLMAVPLFLAIYICTVFHTVSQWTLQFATRFSTTTTYTTYCLCLRKYSYSYYIVYILPALAVLSVPHTSTVPRHGNPRFFCFLFLISKSMQASSSSSSSIISCSSSILILNNNNNLLPPKIKTWEETGHFQSQENEGKKKRRVKEQQYLT